MDGFFPLKYENDGKSCKIIVIKQENLKIFIPFVYLHYSIVKLKIFSIWVRILISWNNKSTHNFFNFYPIQMNNGSFYF